jgi:hypothetical protein
VNDGASLILTLAGVVIIAGVILLAVVTKGQKQLDKQKYRSRWLKIESSLKKDSQSSYHLAVLNADKLLDHAMKEAGYKGSTMGERLKGAKQVFTNRNAVWSAHKLRNQIAHEPDVQVEYETARRALASLKQALRDVGAI